jgi:hypothetical protein
MVFVYGKELAGSQGKMLLELLWLLLLLWMGCGWVVDSRMHILISTQPS